MSATPQAQGYRDELRAAGLRGTSGRIAVLGALDAAPHSSAEAVYSAVSQELASTSPQAIYLVLSDLLSAGLIRKFEPAGSPALYERRIGDNHHHLVCDVCGRVQDVDCAVGAPPCLQPVTDAEFVVREAEVTFWGTCADCLAGHNDRPSTRRRKSPHEGTGTP